MKPYSRAMPRWLLWLVTISAVLNGVLSFANEPRPPALGSVSAIVTAIADGDTLYLPIEGRSTPVRLAQIDAPEKR